MWWEFLSSEKLIQKIYLIRLCASVLIIVTANTCSRIMIITILFAYQSLSTVFTERTFEIKTDDKIHDRWRNKKINSFLRTIRRGSAPIEHRPMCYRQNGLAHSCYKIHVIRIHINKIWIWMNISIVFAALNSDYIRIMYQLVVTRIILSNNMQMVHFWFLNRAKRLSEYWQKMALRKNKFSFEHFPTS